VTIAPAFSDITGGMSLSGFSIKQLFVISSTVVAGSNLTLTGGGGLAGGTYYVLGSTNMSLPKAQWMVLSTNSFDDNGNFNTSVSVDPVGPMEFLSIKE
jgi:hypothetical protein